MHWILHGDLGIYIPQLAFDVQITKLPQIHNVHVTHTSFTNLQMKCLMQH